MFYAELDLDLYYISDFPRYISGKMSFIREFIAFISESKQFISESKIQAVLKNKKEVQFFDDK